jgi:rhodanese-related sulfurtransferase
MNTITTEKFVSALSGGDVPLLLDVRTPAEFEGSHVTGAKNLPLNELSVDRVRAIMQECGAASVHLICKSGARAMQALATLREGGVTSCFCVEGGTERAATCGAPMTRGSTRVISLERQVRIGAGVLVLVGGVLGLTVHSGFIGLALFVGAGLVFAGVTDWCGMALLLGRMPWNQGSGNQGVKGAACQRKS